MKRSAALLLCFCLLLSLCGCGAAEEKTEKETYLFTDSCGRTVELPAEIETVVPSGSLSQMILYTVCPEKLLSLASALSRTQKRYLDERIWELPVTGQLYGGSSTLNIEEILRAAPDVIIDMGETMVGMASDLDGLQAQTGIPVIFIEASLDAMEQAYRTLGEITGDTGRAAACADFIRDTLDDVKKRAAQIPENERLRTVYAVGENGTEVYGKGSLHAETLELVGAENAADAKRGNSKGRTVISAEQLLLWDPDVLILGADADRRDILNDPALAGVSAVKTGRVYAVPAGPYNWLDQPPSVQRILGLKWLGNVLYPEIYDYDMTAEAREFYSLFWNYDLTGPEALALMGRDTPDAGP